MTLVFKKRYKKLIKYYQKLELNKLNLLYSNFFLSNFIYYSNSNLIWYQNFLYKYNCKNYFIYNNNIVNNYIISKNINNLLNKKNIDQFLKFPNLDIIYLKLNTHKKLISLVYLIKLFNLGNDLYGMQNKLIIILINSKIKLLLILNKKNLKI